MANLPNATITHATAGRARFRITARRGDRDYFRRLAVELADCDGVLRVDASAKTGSVLLRHRSDLPTIARFAAEHDLFAVADRAHQTSSDAANVVVSSAARIAGTPRLASATLLAGLGALQVMRGQILAPAVTLFWYAANSIGLEAIEAIVRRRTETPAARTTTAAPRGGPRRATANAR